MANNVMRGIRVCDGDLVCLDLSVDLPCNSARNPSCYLLSMRWFSLEEERVMQQSSVSHLVPAQTIKNLATNAIKGLSIPSRPLGKVSFDKDNKINIFWYFCCIDWKVKIAK